ncbi:Retrograde regulation protein 2 [Elsinoe australis]|uniref:Retrograde regulation protein 2 n=1 Tax=Elsinoe australis TaxID=40998 RepID=A0A2P7YGI9_9PEZI|nr:Retrograde regulation protein 2 [Elsinoe australis]
MSSSHGSSSSSSGRQLAAGCVSPPDPLHAKLPSHFDPKIYQPWKAYDVRNRLPPGWEGWVHRENGWITYVNRAEGKAQRLHPSGRFYNEGLPLPWQSAISPERHTYYQNHVTQQVQFRMPSGAKYVWGFGYVPINWADRRDANHDRYCIGTVFNPKL